jgi:hypothetical protein
MTPEEERELLTKVREIHRAMCGTTSQPRCGNAPQRQAEGLPTTFPNYGRQRGQEIQGATAADLDYYASGCRRTLADPAKSRWHAREQTLLTAIEQEQARQARESDPDDLVWK